MSDNLPQNNFTSNVRTVDYGMKLEKYSKRNPWKAMKGGGVM